MVCIVAGFDKVVVRRSVHVDQNEWSFFCADVFVRRKKNYYSTATAHKGLRYRFRCVYHRQTQLNMSFRLASLHWYR